MSYHQLISLFVILFFGYRLIAPTLHLQNQISPIERLTFVCQLVTVGVVGSTLAGILNNYYYHEKIILGENYWGALTLTLLFLPNLIPKKDKIQLTNQIIKYTLIGTIFVKIGCAISHQECYGRTTEIFTGVINKHPLPIYEALMHGIFFLLYSSIKGKFGKYIGIVWLAFTITLAFFIDAFKVYPFREFLSLPQMFYLILYLLTYRLFAIIYKEG